MTLKLFCQAILKYALGVLMTGLIIFLSAGTVKYPAGWLFMGILFIPMFIAGILLMFKNPYLLRIRLEARENQKEQQLVIKLSGLMFIFGFVIAGLDFRFGLFPVPEWLSVFGAVVFLSAYVMYGEVLRENTYLSRTIHVQENQKLIDTGLYGIVRHPMYSATLVLFTAIPFVLGSLIALPVFLIYPVIIAKRITNEEKILEKSLDGYKEYKTKVKYRLIPYIW